MQSKQDHPGFGMNRAFTLVEMIVVITIIAILLAVVVPGVSGMLDSTRLASAGSSVTGLFLEAQQIASTRGRPVELRIYKGAASPSGEQSEFKAIMILTHYVEGESDPSNLAEVLGQPVNLVEGNGAYILPDDVIFHPKEEYSSLLGGQTKGDGGASKLSILGDNGKLQSYTPQNLSSDYHSFLLLPEGTNLAPQEKWFLTILQSRGGKPPGELTSNFYTLQINPVTSNVTTYRP